VTCSPRLVAPSTSSTAQEPRGHRRAELGASIATEVLDDEQVDWIRGHHERWDGTGYPDALNAEKIPDGAQILALADAWDVMTKHDHYKPTKTNQRALDECQTLSGSQFAPTAVDALLALNADRNRQDGATPSLPETKTEQTALKSPHPRLK